jgi:hypothetical protein
LFYWLFVMLRFDGCASLYRRFTLSRTPRLYNRFGNTRSSSNRVT